MSKKIKFLGNNIKFYRKRLNLTQLELAEKIDIDAKYLSRIETGFATPSLNTIQKIADVLKVDVVKFFECEEYKNKKEITDILYEKIEVFSFEKLKLLLQFADIIDTQIK